MDKLVGGMQDKVVNYILILCSLHLKSILWREIMGNYLSEMKRWDWNTCF